MMPEKLEHIKNKYGQTEAVFALPAVLASTAALPVVQRAAA